MIIINDCNRDSFGYDSLIDYLLERKIKYEVIPAYELSDEIRLEIQISSDDTAITPTVWKILHALSSEDYKSIVIL